MSAFRQPPPIEDLSDLSWKRVEQKLASKLDALSVSAPPSAPSRSRWPWVASASVGIAAVAAAALLAIGSGDGDGDGDEAKPKMALNENTSEIITQESSTDLLVPGAHLEVSPHSELAVEQQGENLTVRLRDGGVRLDVDPRDHQSPLTVVSGDVRIEVVGTEFAVYQSAGQTQVTVFEGLVAVSHQGKRELVKAGEQWPNDSAQETAGPTRAASATRSRVRHKSARAATLSAKNTETPAPVSTRQLYEDAAAKELEDPAEALLLYRQAAHATGPWAANALYAQARLLLAQGERAKAKMLLKRYQRRYPSGANVGDAEALLQDL